MSAPPAQTKGLWVGLLLGLPFVAYGFRGVLADLPGVQLTSFGWYFVGAAVVHDVLVAPAVCVLGWFVLRRLPAVAVGPVQAALLASGVIGLVSWPFVRGYGVTPGEPSFLSRDYTRSVLVLWSVVWAVAVVVVTSRAVIARRR